jgi:hypothetical protein
MSSFSNDDDNELIDSFTTSISCQYLYSSLTKFHLYRPFGVTGARATALFFALARSRGAQLQELHLGHSFNTLRDESPLDVAHSLAALIESAPSLRSLRFTNHGFLVGAEFGQVLFNAIVHNLTALRTLDLCENYFADLGIGDDSTLEWLRNSTTLCELDLSECLLLQRAPAVIQSVARHPSLQRFRFAHLDDVCSDTANAIVDFVQNSPRTTEFDLTGSCFHDENDFVRVLDAVRRGTRLQAIGISTNAAVALDAARVDALVSLVDSNTTLRSLAVRGRRFALAADCERFVAALVRNKTLLFVSESRFETLPFDVFARNRCNLLRDVAAVLFALPLPLPPYVVGEIVQYCPEFYSITYARTMRTICGVHESLQRRQRRLLSGRAQDAQ